MSQGLKTARTRAQLNKAREAHELKTVSHVNDTTESSYEESASNNPVFNGFYKDGGSNPIRYMCSFAAPEFDDIWLIISNDVSAHWNVGGG